MQIQNISNYNPKYQQTKRQIYFEATTQDSFVQTPATSKNKTKKYLGVAAAALTIIPLGIIAIYNALKHGKVEPLTNAAEEIQRTFTNKRGEKLIIEYKNNIIQKATKYLKDGTIAHIKEYFVDESGKRIIKTLKPDTKGNFIIDKIVEITKESVVQYNGTKEFINKYVRKIGNTWKNITASISQNSVRQPSAQTIYIQQGQDINRFLRSGEFHNHQFVDKRIPTEIPDNNLKPYIESVIKEAKETNRQIIDIIPKLDEKTYSSRTTKPMIVYRDAPTSWLDSATDGKLIDRGYCSTSTVRGASMEGIIGDEPKTTFEILLDENMPFWDLTHTVEKEMLLPRNLEFEIIGPNKLRCLGPISE